LRSALSWGILSVRKNPDPPSELRSGSIVPQNFEKSQGIGPSNKLQSFDTFPDPITTGRTSRKSPKRDPLPSGCGRMGGGAGRLQPNTLTIMGCISDQLLGAENRIGREIATNDGGRASVAYEIEVESFIKRRVDGQAPSKKSTSDGRGST
jgi:hypothetical protein